MKYRKEKLKLKKIIQINDGTKISLSKIRGNACDLAVDSKDCVNRIEFIDYLRDKELVTNNKNV